MVRKHTIEASGTFEHLPSNERQQCPYARCKQEEDRRTKEDDVQLLAGACVTQSGAECTEELLVQIARWRVRTTPPQQRRNDDQVRPDVRPVGHRSTEARQQQATQRGANRAGDVHAQRVQRYRAAQRFARHQLQVRWRRCRASTSARA